MAFRIGQQVVCVDDGFEGYGSPHGLYIFNLHGLKKCRVYTVRGLYDGGDLAWPHPGIYLDEIVRPLMPAEPFEAPFAAKRFRPVKTTDISVFTAMLVPASKKAVDA